MEQNREPRNFWRRSRSRAMGKDSLFNQWCWNNWTSTWNIILDPDLTPFTKINSKCITEINVKCKAGNLLEDNTGQNLHDLDMLTNNTSKKWAKDLNRHFTEEDVQMTNKPMKRCSTWYVVRKMQTRRVRYPLQTYRNGQSPRHRQHCRLARTRSGRTLTHHWWESKTLQPLWKTAWQFLPN